MLCLSGFDWTIFPLGAPKLLGDWHFWEFLGVAENIVGSLLFCGVSIVQCLLNKTFVFHFPTDEAL